MTSKKDRGVTDRKRHQEDQGNKRSFSARLRTYFLTGVVVAAPISITIYLTWLFVVTVDKRITPLIPAKYNPETYLPVGIPGLGVVIVVLFLILLGMITANFFGRSLLNLGERVVDNLPVVRTIYGTLKQIFETIISQSSMSFRDVVLVEYPRKGLYAIAFVTAPTKGEIATRHGSDMVNVFLPTTPNPTSGFLLFVPKEDVTYLDMTVEEGVKYVISAGLVTPPQRMEKAAGIDPDPEEREVLPVTRDIET
ncbi:MAG: DUF502 domain-containing protein [Pseudomonadota bacterium]